MPFATVVIPTYNRHEHLSGALDALERQAETEVPFSVVVVDDGSAQPVRLPDRSWPFGIRLVRLEQNTGRAAARNAGLAVVESPLVIFLDDDMRPQDGFVRAYVEAMEQEHRAVGLGHVVFDPDIPRDRLTVYLETRGIAKLAPDDPIPFRYFLTYNSAVPTELLRRVGGFDGRLQVWGGEDLELGWRLHKAGARFVRVPEARAYHAHRRSLGEFIDVSMGFGERSLPIVLDEHPELVQLLQAHIFGPRRYRNSRSLRRAVVRAFTHPPLLQLARRVVSAWPRFPWPLGVFDYLIVSAWRQGLDRAESVHSAIATKPSGRVS